MHILFILSEATVISLLFSTKTSLWAISPLLSIVVLPTVTKSPTEPSTFISTSSPTHLP